MWDIRRKTSIILALALMIAGSVALAGEEGGEGGEAKKKEPKTAAEEYTVKTTRMNALQVKMLDSQKEFSKLVEEKDHEKNPAAVQEIIKQMVEVTKERNKDADEFNSIKNELLYKYPSKNAELNQNYDTQGKKNVDDMQSGADLDELLNRVKKVIEREFAPFAPPAPAKPVTKEESKQEPEPRLRLEK